MGKKKTSARGGVREGAGRKVGDEGRAVAVSASVPEPLVASLDAIAVSKGWNRSKAVTEAIRAYVGRRSLAKKN